MVVMAAGEAGRVSLARRAMRTPSRKLEVVQLNPMKAGRWSRRNCRIAWSESGWAKQSMMVELMLRCSM